MENKRKRRSSNDIEDSINRATVHLIEEAGFPNITVRGITRIAKIEAAVFYNRYNDLSSFIDDFVKKYDYWFSDVARECINIEDNRKQYIAILNCLFSSLKGNKLMQELLKWEISTNNNITQRTAKLREFHTLPLVEKYKKKFENSPVEIDAVSALIIGGIYYLVLHAELSPFGNIDVNTESGDEKIRKAIEYLGNLFFSEICPDSRVLDIARKMKEKGLEATMIAECTDLPVDVVLNL